MDLLFTLLVFVVTVVGQIRISWRWFLQVLFILFLTLFLRIVFLFVWFTVIGIISRIIFVQWWVWRWWFWLQVRWYMWFYFSICWIYWSCWIIRWSCRRIRWLCQRCGFWIFCPDRNQVNLWRCSVGHFCTKRSRVQRWSTHRNILAPKILILPPSFKISFVTIVLLWPSAV